MHRAIASAGRVKAASIGLAMGCLLAGVLSPGQGQAAPGGAADGAAGGLEAPPRWTTGKKTGLGTALTAASPVWFTLAESGLTEVYWPSIDRAQVRSLELEIVVRSPGARPRLYTAGDPALHTRTRLVAQPPEVPVLVYEQITEPAGVDAGVRQGHGPGAPWTIVRRYAVDPARPAMLVELEQISRRPGLSLEVRLLFDPALGNSGSGDRIRRDGNAVVAWKGNEAVALASEHLELAEVALGRLGLEVGPAPVDMKDRPQVAPAAALGQVAGNVAARVLLSRSPGPIRGRSTFALGFGMSQAAALATARAALANRFETVLAANRRQWEEQLRALGLLSPWPGLPAELWRKVQVAAQVLLACEDRQRQGAVVAALAIPWGEAVDASSPTIGGYHLVWPRDLYHVATAFLAIAERTGSAAARAAAARTLEYLFGVQQRPDGSFPQNSWLDGRAYWGSLQLDEVAVPILLAEALGKTDAATYQRVKRSADFIVAKGPSTPQERWEEEGGYSPATLAAEVAGLACAAELAERHGDVVRARLWRAVADSWERQIERWTVTTTGPHGRRYFVRITQDGRPDAGKPLEINNGGGTHDERSIVDPSVLELVRLGVRPADDPDVRATTQVIDRLLRVATPRGMAFFRYNHDGYGETKEGGPFLGEGVGRLWPLLTGERGEYELARGQTAAARRALETLARFAGPGLLLSEQVWEKNRPGLRAGDSTGSATPLTWAMAGLVRLAASVSLGRPLVRPAPAARRYARPPALRPRPARLEARVRPLAPGSGRLLLEGTTDAEQVVVRAQSRHAAVPVQGGRFALEIAEPPRGEPVWVAALSTDGQRTAALRLR
jgi:glucoamylase